MIRIADDWREATQFAGITYRNTDESTVATAARNMAEDEYERGLISFDEMAIKLKQTSDEAYSVEEIKKIYLSIINNEFPGMADFVLSLQKNGYYTACLSNTCDAHWEQFLHSGRYPAIEMLDAHFASHLMGLRKPDEKIYRLAMEKLKTTGKDIIFFDDKTENISGALRCGWNAIQIKPNRSSILQMKNYISRFEKNTKNTYCIKSENIL